MAIKIGINGLGRIGRMIIRSLIEKNYKDIEIKHINNRSNSETTCALLKHDSVHGKFNVDLEFDEKSISINKNNIQTRPAWFPIHLQKAYKNHRR